MRIQDKAKYIRTLKLMKCTLEGLCLLQKIVELEKKKKSKKKKKRFRSCSVQEGNRYRLKNGFFVQTFLVIKETNHQQFLEYTRMTPQIYELLLELIRPFLEKKALRECVPPECRLAVTLIFLSQGASFQSLAWSFKLGKETVRKIILETCDALWSVLSNPYVCEPSEEDYKQTAVDFWQLWHVPNCIGALDGKHISIRCPPNSNYKKWSSIVMIAACDARYLFTHVDIGGYGSPHDGGIFQLSRFGKRLINNYLPIPPPRNLPNTEFLLPHFFVADTSFPLGANLMRPYPNAGSVAGRDIFNKKLSRARRTIENAFGILISRWQILLTTLHLIPENAEKVVLACITLHNFITLNDESAYIPENYVDWEDSNGDLHEGTWRSVAKRDIPSIKPSGNCHQYGGRSSTEIRKQLCHFFANN